MRGGEHRGVLDEFGEQVDDVGDGVPAEFALDRRDEFDPRVLLDLGDRGAQHLGHGDGVAPLPPGDGAAEDGEVLGVAADAGGEVVDVEEALEEVGVLDLVLQLVQGGDLPVHEGLKASREVDEDLEFLFAARLAGELCGLDDGGDGPVVGAGQVGGEQLELVGVTRRAATRCALRRGVAAAQPVEEGAQVGLAARAVAAQGGDAVADGAGGPVRGHGGDDDADAGHRDGSGEYGPQDRSRPGAGGAHGEQDDRAGAEGDGGRGQYGEAHQLRPYVRLGRCGCGAGYRSSVPSALAAVCACGRCAEVRHRCPRTVRRAWGSRGVRSSGSRHRGVGRGSESPAAPSRSTATDSSCQPMMREGQLAKSPGERPALV